MPLIARLIDLIIHLDKHLSALIQSYGLWTYLILFAVIFCETGLVVTPFLPGDSLLFAAGFFAAPDAQTGVSALPLFALLPVVWCAPVIGDQCNYWIGHFFGRRILESGKVKAMTPERIEKTEKMMRQKMCV